VSTPCSNKATLHLTVQVVIIIITIFGTKGSWRQSGWGWGCRCWRSGRGIRKTKLIAKAANLLHGLSKRLIPPDVSIRDRTPSVPHGLLKVCPRDARHGIYLILIGIHSIRVGKLCALSLDVLLNALPTQGTRTKSQKLAHPCPWHRRRHMCQRQIQTPVKTCIAFESVTQQGDSHD
jgi:hypothetical protein